MSGLSCPSAVPAATPLCTASAGGAASVLPSMLPSASFGGRIGRNTGVMGFDWSACASCAACDGASAAAEWSSAPFIGCVESDQFDMRRECLLAIGLPIGSAAS